MSRFIQTGLQDVGPTFGMVGPASLECTGDLVQSVAAATATAAWPGASRAIFLPFEVRQSKLLMQAVLNHGATNSGNVDVGVYTLAGSLIVAAGSTAVAASGAVDQIVNLTDTVLVPDVYWAALVYDNTTTVENRWSTASLQWMIAGGIQQMASAFPLPGTATFANPTTAYIPSFSLSFRSVA